MFEEAKKYVTRKIKKLDYLNTPLPEGYEATTEEYRKVRDDIDLLAAVIKNLTNYEHGGQLMKGFSNWSNILSQSARIKALKRDDIYTNAGLVGEHLSESVEANASFKKTSKNFSDAYIKISDAKKKMNDKMNEILTSLSIFKKDSKTIDSLRNKTADLRYDLESMIQKNSYGENEKSQLQAEFNTSAAESLSKMKEFVGDNGIAGVVVKAAEAHREFSKTAAEALSKVK